MWNRRKCHLVNVTVFEGELEKHLLSLIDLQKLFLKTGRILLKYLSWMAFFFFLLKLLKEYHANVNFCLNINWDSIVSYLISFYIWELDWKVFITLESYFLILSHSRSYLKKTRFSLLQGDRFETIVDNICWKCLCAYSFCVVRWWKKA